MQQNERYNIPFLLQGTLSRPKQKVYQQAVSEEVNEVRREIIKENTVYNGKIKKWNSKLSDVTFISESAIFS